MKKILICILCFVATQGYCQFRVGVEGGLTTSNFWQTDGYGGLSTGLSSWPISAFYAGVMGELDLGYSGVVFQPAILYYENGSHLGNSVGFPTTGPANIDYTNTHLEIYSLRIPLNFIYKFALTDKIKVMAGAGPYFAKTLSGTEKGFWEGSTQDNNGDFIFAGGGINNKVVLSDNYSQAVNGTTNVNSYDIGGDFLIGVEYKKFQLTGSYSRGFTRMYRTQYANCGNFSWNLGIGYLLFGHDRKPKM
jgi:hypothetical protein